MADLHPWMQSWFDQGERSPVRVECTDRMDGKTLGTDGSEEEFRTIEASL